MTRHVRRVRRNGGDLFETWHVTKRERWPVEVNTSFWPAAGNPACSPSCATSPSAGGPIALQESEARFRATFEQAAVGIAHVSPKEGRWLRVNQALRNSRLFARGADFP